MRGRAQRRGSTSSHHVQLEVVATMPLTIIVKHTHETIRWLLLGLPAQVTRVRQCQRLSLKATPPLARMHACTITTVRRISRNLERKYSQPKIIPSKREMTTDIGINSTDFTRKKYAKSAPPEQAGPNSTYLPPASCCVKTFWTPSGQSTKTCTCTCSGHSHPRASAQLAGDK